MNNYERFSEESRKLFLTKDQDRILQKFRSVVDADGEFLYFRFAGRPARLSRRDAAVQKTVDPVSENKREAFTQRESTVSGEPSGNGARTDGDVLQWTHADINMALTVYDMFGGHLEFPELPQLSGKWESLASIGGVIGSRHVQSLQQSGEADVFSGHVPELKKACAALGGTDAGKSGDVSQIIPLFDFFPCWFQFWDGDEEFPASYQFLFDHNALYFLKYETIWYAMNALLDRMVTEAKRCQKKIE